MLYRIISIAIFINSTWMLANTANANGFLQVTVTKHSGEPFAHVVVSAFPLDAGGVTQTAEQTTQKIVIIDQIDKEFIAHITPIQIGTAINFPNHDQIRHHVYSFSPAKHFEIPLYEGMPDEPIVFDNPGAVALGCNIHDWMSAYVYVTETPYFSSTDAKGIAMLTLPDGNYELHFWHPQLDADSRKNKPYITVVSETQTKHQQSLGSKQVWSFRRGPMALHNRGRYR